MPVYKLKEEMPYTELLQWIEFFSRRPVGWQEDQRAYLFLRTQGVKESAENVFPSLRQLKTKRIEKQENDKALPQGKFLEMMLKAHGGDDWKPEWKKKNVKN